MKKALVLALTAFMVLSLATAAFAVEVSYEGKVAVTWGGSSQGDEKTEPGFEQEALEASVTIDFTKDFGNGVSAGVKAKTEIHNDTVWDDANENEEYDPEEQPTRELAFDGGGWVQLERDLFTAKVSTSIDGGVGKDFGEYGLDGDPGFGLDLFLVEGLTINTLVNAGPDYRFLVKGEYAADLFSIGGGFQNDTIAEKTAFGVYGSADLIDGLTLNAEFGNRKEGDADAATAILASASYDGLLNATASFYTVKEAFGSIISEDDKDEFLARDRARFKPDNDYSVIFVDASYNVTDALAIDGSLDYILSAKKDGKKVEDFEDNLSYKVGATYTFDALKFEGWYKAYVNSQVGGKATYALAEGVDASFELKYDMFDDKDTDAKVTYTAKVEAGF